MNDLARMWIEAKEGQLYGKPLSDKGEDAAVHLLELVMNNPDAAFNTILEIIRLKPSEDILRWLGAGPIENLLVEKPEYLQKMINSVSDKVSLKQCLQSVDYDDEDGLDVELLEDFLNGRTED